jgi:hypothetical protein
VRFVVALIALALATGCGGEDAAPRAATPTPTPEPAAREPDALAVEWWRWAAGRPAGEDPVSDRTGARCGQDQPDDVFFLAGSSGGRTTRRCDVPADRPLFFPAINILCPKDVGVDNCVAEVRRAEVQVTVDGRPVKTRWIVSRRFDPESHPRSTVAQVGPPTVTAGHYALVDPLAAGRHAIEFSGRAENGFALAVRYRLLVR